MLTLQWRQVDFGAGEVRLDAGTTKNNEGRVFPMTASSAECSKANARAGPAATRTRLDLPWVFHRERRADHSVHEGVEDRLRQGRLPGRIPTTSVDGGPKPGPRRHAERVAMQMTGHKTRSVFERYNIVSETDFADAVDVSTNVTGIVWA